MTAEIASSSKFGIALFTGEFLVLVLGGVIYLVHGSDATHIRNCTHL